ncbi:hypothetical protein [Streptomyces sp. NPDC002769]|uniref:hypothetical protein n=1 Tax=Streptomyces sp. NPDC002769 TaxID=3154542 RepID=UPI0033333951
MPVVGVTHRAGIRSTADQVGLDGQPAEDGRYDGMAKQPLPVGDGAPPVAE